MKTPLAIINLWHQGAKTLVSIGGVAFALLLVFMQLGFMGAVSSTATQVLKNLDFDVMVRARDYVHLYEPGQLDRKWLTTIEGLPAVQSAVPIWVTLQNWRAMPNAAQAAAEAFESQYLPIAVMAVSPEDPVFVDDRLQSKLAHLGVDADVLLDDSTQTDYGPWQGRRFTEADFGRQPEIGGRAFSIAESFKLGTGLAANGAVIMRPGGFSRITPFDVSKVVSMGLLKIEDASPDAIRRFVAKVQDLARIYPVDNPLEENKSSGLGSGLKSWFGAPEETPRDVVIEVLSKRDVLDRETYRWLWQTPIGLIFQLGVVLSLMVGAAIVYMVLSTDVANRLPEYATLLAMGYSRKYLASIVMTQALALCGLGLVTAWGAAELLYRMTASFSSIPLSMTLERVILVSILGVLMCCVSGLLALRKLWKAEPASLF